MKKDLRAKKPNAFNFQFLGNHQCTLYKLYHIISWAYRVQDFSINSLYGFSVEC